MQQCTCMCACVCVCMCTCVCLCVCACVLFGCECGGGDGGTYFICTQGFCIMLNITKVLLWCLLCYCLH